MSTPDKRMESEKENLMLVNRRLHLEILTRRDAIVANEHRISAICRSQQEKREALEGGERDSA